MVARLREQLPRLVEAIERLTPAQLAELQLNNRSLRYSILHGLHDEADHQGEMYLLRKMLKMGAR